MIATLLATLVPNALAATIQVEGEGYLRFAQEGKIVYSRKAKLIQSEGRLKHESGASAMPLLLVPSNATNLRVEKDGTVSISVGSETKQIGRILLATFAQGDDLTPQGPFFLAKSRPKLVVPGESGSGVIVQLGSGSSNQPIISKPSKQPTSTPKQPGAAIVIAPTVTLQTQRITVDQFVTGDLADLIREKLKQVDFGPAPRSGFTTKITRPRIESKLIVSGFDLSSPRFQIPEIVEVSAPCQVIEARKFIEAALKACEEKFGAALELKIEGEVEPYRAPIGSYELKSESIIERGGQIVATLGIFVDTQRVNGKTITFSGQAPAVVVKSGDLVKVEMRASGIAVEVTGRAKKSGRIGEAIEIEVIAGDPPTKTVHLAIVKGIGRVEVRI